MDSRNYSSFTDLVRGNINLEDELFDESESSPLLVKDSLLNDEVATSKKKPTCGVNFSTEEDKLLVQHGSILVSILCMVMSNIKQHFMAKLRNTLRTTRLILHVVLHP